MEAQKPGYVPLTDNSIAIDQTYPPGYAQSQDPYAPSNSNTNVIVVPPTATPYTQTTTVITHQPAKRPWNSELCDCFNEMESCCLATFLGTYYAGCIGQRMGENYCVGCGLQGLWPMRSAFRERHNIEGNLCDDCCIAYWCFHCAVCQMSREMDRLGYPKAC